MGNIQLDRMIGHEIGLLGPWPLFHTWPLPALLNSAARNISGQDSVDAPGTPDQIRKLPELGAWECDLKDNSLKWAPKVYDLFGLSLNTRIQRADTVALYCEESREAMEMLRAYAIRHRRGFTMDARLIRPDGQSRWMRLTAAMACDRGRPRHLFGTKQDITFDRSRRECLKGTAGIDALTGFATRAAFEARFFQDFVVGSSSRMLLTIDVDNIEGIERKFGASASDACFRAVGSRLGVFSDNALMVARVGDYRFAVLMDASAGLKALNQKVRRLMRELAMPIYWQGYLLHVAPCAGTAASSAATSAEELFSVAVANLNAAKRKIRWVGDTTAQ